MQRRLLANDLGNAWFEQRSPEGDMNIGEIVREVEVMLADEPAIPAPEPAREEPIQEGQPA